MTVPRSVLLGLYLAVVIELFSAHAGPVKNVSAFVPRCISIALAFVGESKLPRSAEGVFIENAASHADPHLALHDHGGSVVGVNVGWRRMLTSLEQQNWRHQIANGDFVDVPSIRSGADGRYDSGGLPDVFKLNVDPPHVVVLAFDAEQLNDEERLLKAYLSFDRASSGHCRSARIPNSRQYKGARYAAYNKLPEGPFCGVFSSFRHAALLTQIVVVLAVGGTTSWLVWRGGWISIDRPRTGLAMLICAMLLYGTLLGSLLWCIASGHG